MASHSSGPDTTTARFSAATSSRSPPAEANTPARLGAIPVGRGRSVVAVVVVAVVVVDGLVVGVELVVGVVLVVGMEDVVDGA